MFEEEGRPSGAAANPRSPTGRQPIGISLVDVVGILSFGTSFDKYGRQGKPAKRMVRLTPDSYEIQWESKAKSKAESTIRIGDIVEIRVGIGSDNFKRFSIPPEKAQLCFTIVFVSPMDDRTSQVAAAISRASVETDPARRTVLLNALDRERARRENKANHRTLDLLAFNEYQLDLWLHGLRELTLKHRLAEDLARAELAAPAQQEGQMAEVPNPVLSPYSPSAPHPQPQPHHPSAPPQAQNGASSMLRSPEPFSSPLHIDAGGHTDDDTDGDPDPGAPIIIQQGEADDNPPPHQASESASTSEDKDLNGASQAQPPPLPARPRSNPQLSQLIRHSSSSQSQPHQSPSPSPLLPSGSISASAPPPSVPSTPRPALVGHSAPQAVSEPNGIPTPLSPPSVHLPLRPTPDTPNAHTIKQQHAEEEKDKRQEHVRGNGDPSRSGVDISVPVLVPHPIAHPTPASMPAPNSQSASAGSPSSPLPDDLSSLVSLACASELNGLPNWEINMKIVMVASKLPFGDVDRLLRKPPLSTLLQSTSPSSHASGLAALILFESLAENAPGFLRLPTIRGDSEWMVRHLVKTMPRWVRKPYAPKYGMMRSVFTAKPTPAEEKAEQDATRHQRTRIAMLRWNKTKVIIASLAMSVGAHWADAYGKLSSAGAYSDASIKVQPVDVPVDGADQPQPQLHASKESSAGRAAAVSSRPPVEARAASSLLAYDLAHFNAGISALSSCMSHLSDLIHASGDDDASLDCESNRAQLAAEAHTRLSADHRALQAALTKATNDRPKWLKDEQLDQMININELIHETLKSYKSPQPAARSHSGAHRPLDRASVPPSHHDWYQNGSHVPAAASASSSSSSPHAYVPSSHVSSSAHMHVPAGAPCHQQVSLLEEKEFSPPPHQSEWHATNVTFKPNDAAYAPYTLQQSDQHAPIAVVPSLPSSASSSSSASVDSSLYPPMHDDFSSLAALSPPRSSLPLSRPIDIGLSDSRHPPNGVSFRSIETPRPITASISSPLSPLPDANTLITPGSIEHIQTPIPIDAQLAHHHDEQPEVQQPVAAASISSLTFIDEYDFGLSSPAAAASISQPAAPASAAANAILTPALALPSPSDSDSVDLAAYSSAYSYGGGDDDFFSRPVEALTYGAKAKRTNKASTRKAVPVSMC